MDNGNESNAFELVLVNALKVPGVKVNRKEFLAKTLTDYVSSEKLVEVLEKGPLDAGMDLKVINKLAKALIEKRTLQSTGVSFAAGLPGGVGDGRYNSC